MQQKKGILLIEDSEYGKVFTDLLTNYDPNWDVTWVDSMEKLKTINNYNVFHVFVFDQRLGNGELGTDAYRYVHKKNPHIQGIMFSDVALAGDFMELKREIAPEILLYLPKSKVENLPELVRNAIDGYYIAHAIGKDKNIQQEERIIAGKFWAPKIVRKPQIKILQYYIVSEEHVFANDWQAINKIRSGEKRVNIKIEKSSVSDIHVMEAQYGANIQVGTSENSEFIKHAIEAYCSKKFSHNYTITHDIEKREETTSELPAGISSNPNKQVLSVRYEVAPAYQHIRVKISVKCYCCDNVSFSEYDTYIPIKTKERTIITYTDDTQDVIEETI